MSFLKIIDADNIESAKQMYLVFGEPGTGKTYAVRNLPGNTIYVALDGTESILKKQHPKNLKVVILEKDDVIDICKMFPLILTTIERKYLSHTDNIVFDNISYLQDMVMAQIKGTSKDGRMDWGKMQDMIKKWVIRIRSWNKRVYMTAWEERFSSYDNNGDQVTLFDVKLNGKLRSSIKGLFTVVGRTFIHNGEHLIQLAPDGRRLVKNQIDQRKFCRVEDLFTEKEYLPNQQVKQEEQIENKANQKGDR